MSSEIVNENHLLADAVARAGHDELLRSVIFESLRESETRAEDPLTFREQVRWPLILSLLRDVNTHRVVLENGIVFDVNPDSRIEKALLLSTEVHPDHVWEPQTTKLLVRLSAHASHAIIGGAYIGDQAIPIAKNCSGTVHAFEPMKHSFARLLHHIHVNNLENVVAHCMGLWDSDQVQLRLQGHLGVASSVVLDDDEPADQTTVQSISIDEYVHSRELSSVELIMLDTEGSEENALAGARETIDRYAPNIVFEIHRNFIDWTCGLDHTSIVRFLTLRDYRLFAIRDFHSNYPMAGSPIEIIPISQVYLDGPPHGFNVLATRDVNLVERLGLSVVTKVSPKLLLDKDPALHFPLSANFERR